MADSLPERIPLAQRRRELLESPVSERYAERVVAGLARVPLALMFQNDDYCIGLLEGFFAKAFPDVADSFPSGPRPFRDLTYGTAAVLLERRFSQLALRKDAGSERLRNDRQDANKALSVLVLPFEKIGWLQTEASRGWQTEPEPPGRRRSAPCPDIGWVNAHSLKIEGDRDGVRALCEAAYLPPEVFLGACTRLVAADARARGRIFACREWLRRHGTERLDKGLDEEGYPIAIDYGPGEEPAEEREFRRSAMYNLASYKRFHVPRPHPGADEEMDALRVVLTIPLVTLIEAGAIDPAPVPPREERVPSELERRMAAVKPLRRAS